MADSSSAETSEGVVVAPGAVAGAAAEAVEEAAARPGHRDLGAEQPLDRDLLPAAGDLRLSQDLPAGRETQRGKSRLSLTTTAITEDMKAATMCGTTFSAIDLLAVVAVAWAQAVYSSAVALSSASSASFSAPGSGRDALPAVIGTRWMGSEEALSAATLFRSQSQTKNIT